MSAFAHRPMPASRQRLAAGLAVGTAVAGLAMVATGTIQWPSVADAVTGAADTLGAWAYLLVPALAFLETAAFVGLLVPGETAVLVGGVTAERGAVSLPILIALVWAAAVAGDLVSFTIGRRAGRPFLDRNGARLHITSAQIDRAERFFDRHGGAAVLAGRFVGLLRAITPFVAGSSGMKLRRFLIFSLAGGAAWATLITLLGYAFSNSLDAAGEGLTAVTWALALLALAVFATRRAIRSRRRVS